MALRRGPGGEPGFTLLELITVLVIIAILLVMAIPIIEGVRARAERGQCANNLRGLYGGASSYIVEHGHWPQIGTTDLHTPAFANRWIQALQPYGLARKNWICPAVQRWSRGADYSKPFNARIDYLATPFDEQPITPYRWRTQPWFVERADAHGTGNLVIFSDGAVDDLRGIVKRMSPQ